MNPFASAVRSLLSNTPEVNRLSGLRRSTSLFSQGQSADSLYFLEDGLVKLTRVSEGGGRIILTIRGPGQVVGEEVLGREQESYYAEAEVLTPASVYRIPRDLLARGISESSELSSALINFLLEHRLALAKKVELLCLHDVEYRILHYLAELSGLMRPVEDGQGYQVPITQLELADLIGATRETTSTTLNQLERRGLLKLSRRMLTIPSPDTLLNAALAKYAPPPQTAANGAA